MKILPGLPLIYSMVYIVFIFNCMGGEGVKTAILTYPEQLPEVPVQLHKLLLDQRVLRGSEAPSG